MFAIIQTIHAMNETITNEIITTVSVLMTTIFNEMWIEWNAAINTMLCNKWNFRNWINDLIAIKNRKIR